MQLWSRALFFGISLSRAIERESRLQPRRSASRKLSVRGGKIASNQEWTLMLTMRGGSWRCPISILEGKMGLRSPGYMRLPVDR